MHYINPPPPPLSTPNSSQETPPRDPPTLPPLSGASNPPPPPKEKRCHGKNKPPRLETNCTPVVDNVCDNFNLILILVVGADNLFVYNTLEVFLIVCGLGLCALDQRPLQ